MPGGATQTQQTLNRWSCFLVIEDSLKLCYLYNGELGVCDNNWVTGVDLATQHLGWCDATLETDSTVYFGKVRIMLY